MARGRRRRPAFDGQVGILAGPPPFMTLLGKGVRRCSRGGGGGTNRFEVAGASSSGGRRRARRGRSGPNVVMRCIHAPSLLARRLSVCEGDRQCNARDGARDRTDARLGSTAPGRAAAAPRSNSTRRSVYSSIGEAILLRDRRRGVFPLPVALPRPRSMHRVVRLFLSGQ